MDFREFRISKGVSDEDFGNKTPKEIAELHNKWSSERFKNLDEAVKNAATPEQVKEAKDALETFKTENEETLKGFVKTEDLDTIKQELKDAQEEIGSLKEGNQGIGAITFDQAIKDAVKDNHEKLNEFMKGNQHGNGSFTITVKVPAVTTTQNITPTAAGDAYAAQTQTSVSPYPRFSYFVEQALDVGSTELATIPFVDEQPGEGDAAIVAEGTLKPLIDVDYVTSYSQPRKVAGHMKATMEALADYNWLEAAMTSTLRKKHDIARQNDILYGANGIDNLATAFNPVILDGIEPVSSPQKYDVICSLVAAIVNSSEGNYMPNAVLVNTLDMLDMKLTKDADNNYLMPPFAAPDGSLIEGVSVISHPFVNQGNFIIGDMTNIKLRNLQEYRVVFGWENDDFTRNQITMLGESRYHLYITTNDKRGIISGTYADVITKLTTP